MKNLILILALGLAGCAQSGNGNGGNSPLGDDLRETGLGTYVQTKELDYNSPELQPPANCPAGAIVDPRLTTSLTFDGSTRMITEGAGFGGVTFSQNATMISTDTLKSRLRVLQSKGFSTINAGLTIDQTCTKSESGWGCTGTPDVTLPKAFMKYNRCGVKNASSYSTKFGMGTYKAQNGVTYNVIFSRYSTNGQVICDETGENLGDGSSSYATIQSAEMVSPTFQYGCRSTLSVFTLLEAAGKRLQVQQIETTLKN